MGKQVTLRLPRLLAACALASVGGCALFSPRGPAPAPTLTEAAVVSTAMEPRRDRSPAPAQTSQVAQARYQGQPSGTEPPVEDLPAPRPLPAQIPAQPPPGQLPPRPADLGRPAPKQREALASRPRGDDFSPPMPVSPYPPERYYDQLSLLLQRQAEAEDRVRFLTNRLQQCEVALQEKDQALAQATKETQAAFEEIARTRTELQRWKKDAGAMRSNLDGMEKANRETLESMIRALERVLPQEKAPPRKDPEPELRKDADPLKLPLP